MKTILVSGTPGTGKTTIAKKLARTLDFCYIDVNRFITMHKLHDSYDIKRKTKIVDTRKLNRFLLSKINRMVGKENGAIIDSHLSHYFPKKHADLCIIAKCGIGKLSRRLIKKGFHKEKIDENIQAEIFDVCLNDARRMRHKIMVVDTTKGSDIGKIARDLKRK